MQQVYAWSKKIHRIIMWVVVVLGSWMMLSGYLMHKELEGEPILKESAMAFMRSWHNGISQYFLVALLLQMLTGLSMWIVPKMLSQRMSQGNK